MKKKKIILSTCLGALLVIACIGIWLGLRGSKQTVGNGNKLGVEWYHENGDEFVITTVDELLEFAKLSKYYDFKGQTIKLGADIVVNEGSAEDWEKVTPEHIWSPIYGFAGTFDGQGHTISGIYGMGFMLSVLESVYENAPKVETVGNTGLTYLPTGLFAYTQEDCVIKNLNMTNSIFYNDVYTGCGSIVANGAGTLDTVYSDAVIVSYRRNAGGLVGLVENGSFNLTNCWYDGEIRMIGNDGRWSGGLVGNVKSTTGITTIKHCLNTANITSEITRTDVNSGGFVGSVSTSAKLDIEDSLAVGILEAERHSGVGTAVGSAAEGSVLTMKNVYTNLDGYPATIGAIGGTIKSFPLELKETCLIGTNALAWTNLDFEKYWTVVEEGTPMLREYADTIVDKTSASKAYDIAWYDPSKSEYIISTIDEFYGWYILSANNDFSGKTIKLGADLVVNEGKASDWEKEAPSVVWYPIKHFAGTFDGQGHTISGVYLNTNQPGSGLFTTTGNTAELKNFKLTNSYMANRGYNFSYFGGIVGCAEGKLDTIYCDAIISNTAVRSCGGLVGNIIGKDSVYINNCWFDGSITILGQTGSQAGGLVGRVETSATLKVNHCLNSGSLTSERESGILLLGGFIGVAGDSTIEIMDSLNVGKITGLIDNGVASAISWINGKTNLKFYNTYATAESCFKTVDNVLGSYTGGCMPINETYLVGSKGYQWTLLDFEEYWAIQKNGTPILQSFAKSVPSVAGLKKKMDVSWYKTKDKEYTLKTVAEFYGFLYQSYNTNFAKKTVKLGRNIELNKGNAADWGTSAPANPWFMVNNFAGTFDGQGRTINGVYMKNGIQRAGLFQATTDKTTLKNFRLENSYFKHDGDTNGQLGSIVGDFAGEMSKVYSNAIVEGDRLLYGGLVGIVNKNEAKISNCWFDGLVNLGEKGGWAGGIVGLIQGNKGVTIEHCLSTGTVACKNTSAPSIGGVCGIISGEKTAVTIADTLSSGTIDCKASSETGSFIGHVAAKTSLTIKDAYATAETFKSVMGGKKGDITGTCYKLESNVIRGINGYRFTTLNFKNYWSALDNSTPVLKAFAGSGLNTTNVAKMVDTSWYKADKKVYELKDVQGLYGFALLSQGTDFKDKTVKLSNSIVLNNGPAAGYAINVPENVWVPISTFAGTFDGQGNSIQGLYLKTGQQKGGLFSATTVDATIKNLRLENSYFEYDGTAAAQMGGVVAQCAGTIDTVYNDAIIKGNSLLYGGIAGYISKDATIRNCWYSGEIVLGEKGGWVGGITGLISGGCTASIEHCLFTGTVSSENKSVPSVGGICGNIEAKDTTATIVDTLSVGTVTAPTTAGVGSLLGYLNTGSNLTLKDTYVAIESHVNYLGAQKGTLNGGIYKRAMDVLVGDNGYRMTTLDFDKYWAAVESSTPILKSFTNTAMNLSGIARLIDVSWYDENQTVYVLEDKEDLYGFAVLSATMDFKGKTVKLKNDIVVNEGNAEDWSKLAPENPWAPISKFAGSFDGQGNSIKGIYLKAVTSGYGLFSATTTDATLKNFRLENSYFEFAGPKNALLGSIVGELGGTLDGVYSNAIIKGDQLVYGGLAATVSKKANITNCWFDGQMILGATGGWAGGIVGSISGNTTVSITHCLNTGAISSEYKKSPSIGGIGGNITGTKNQVKVEDTLSAGTIQCQATSVVGSLFGYVDKNNTLTLEDTYVTTDNRNVVLGGGNGTIQGVWHKIPSDNLVGIKGYQFTFLDFEKSWSAVEGQVPAPKKLVANELSTNVDKMIHLDWYNEDTYKEKGYYELNTAQDLYGLAYLSDKESFEGKVIKLGRDINVNAGNATKEGWVKADTDGTDYNWSPIGMGKAFAGTFDGQGNTISGIYLATDVKQTGLFATTTKDAVIQDLRLENSYFTTTQNQVGSIVGAFAGRMEKVYSNAIMDCAGKSHIGGLIAVINDNATVSECWYDGIMQTGSFSGGIVANVNDNKAKTAEVVVEHCLNSGNCTATTKDASFGGIIGVPQSAESVLINDSFASGAIQLVSGITSSYVNSLVGCSYISMTVQNSYGYKNDTVKLWNVYTGVTIDYPNTGAISDLSVYLGAGGWNLKNLNFDEYWIAKPNTTPVLKNMSDGFHKNVTTNKDGKTVYTINTGEELYEFAVLSQKTDFEDCIVKLGAETIEANTGKAVLGGWTENDSPSVWTPIGSTTRPFAGTFDGQGNTIRGIYFTTNVKQTGLFAATTKDAVIKDFRLENSYFTTTQNQVGSIVGIFAGRMEKVYSNAIMDCAGKSHIGGLIAVINDSATVSECWYDGIMQTGSFSGGIVANVNDGNNTTADVVIEHCLYNGDTTVTGKDGDFGGIIGVPQKAKSITVNDSLATGPIQLASGITSSHVGSLLGYSYKSMTVQNSYGYKNDIVKLWNVYTGVTIDYPNTGAISDLSVYLGAGGWNLKNLNFDEYWIAKPNTTPVLKNMSDGFHKNVTTNKDGKTVYTINTGEELYEFVVLSQKTDFEDCIVKLGAETIEANTGEAALGGWTKNDNPSVWTPIGSTTRPFAGTFDGQGNTISGIYFTTNVKQTGLFAATTKDAVIKDFRLENSYFTTTQNQVGSIVGIFAGRMEKVYSNAIMDCAGKSHIGGLIAVINDSATVSECWYDGIMQTGSFSGGIVANVNDGNNTTADVVIEHCLYSGESTVTGTDADFGGIIGVPQKAKSIKVDDSLATGDIQLASGTTSSHVGSLLGYAYKSMTVQNSYGYKNDTVKLWNVYTGVTISAPNTGFMASVNDYTGVNGLNLGKLNFATYWVAKQDTTPELKSLTGETTNYVP